MTPLVAEYHARSRRFHADIARRALLVPQRAECLRYDIPNTPFGVPKVLPHSPLRRPRIEVMAPGYHVMWFYDLIQGGETYVPGPALPRRITIRDIQRAACEYYRIPLNDMLSPRRTVKVVRPRQVGYYLAKALTLCSLPEIGRRFNGRDHTSILSGLRKMERLIKTDGTLAQDIENIRLIVEARCA